MKKIHLIALFVAAISFTLSACGTSITIMPTPTMDAFAAKGYEVFNIRCATCHAVIPETIIVGPSMFGVATRAETRMDGYDAKAYITFSIIKPDAYLVEGFTDVMPKNFSKDLTSEELDAVVAYLMTLK